MQPRKTQPPVARAAIVAAILLSAAAHLAAQTAGEVNRIVLRVNEEIATLYDYEKLKQEQLAALAQASLPEARRQAIRAQIGEQTMQNLFQELLVLSRARQIGVAASNEQVNAAIQRTMESYGITDPDDYEAALAQSGLTLSMFREQMRRNLTIQEVMGREVQQRVQLVEEDLRRYYRANSEEFRQPKKIRLREIVVLDSSDLSEDERDELAQRLRSSMLDGSADALLEEHEEAGRTTGWIEHGWIELGDLDPVLADAADGLEAGDVSPPVAARGGLHLLEVDEIQESMIQEFNDVRDQIAARERSRLFDQEMTEYMQELVESSHIVSKPPPDAAGFVPVLGDAGEAESADAERGIAGLDAPPAVPAEAIRPEDGGTAPEELPGSSTPVDAGADPIPGRPLRG